MLSEDEIAYLAPAFIYQPISLSATISGHKNLARKSKLKQLNKSGPEIS